MKKLLTSLGMILLSSAGSVLAQSNEGYKVIANANCPYVTITRGQLSRIFLKKMTRWENGPPVYPVELAMDSPARQSFSRSVHRRSPSAVKSYWQQQIFSGRALPPPEKPTEREVLAFVESTPNSIGYVSSAAVVDGNVKVLKVVD